MGVSGLTSFLAQYQEKYTEWVFLKDCPIVIDGNNLLYYLYNKQVLSSQHKWTSSKPHLFGGDYIGFSQIILKFFSHLKEARIVPVVIFDGAYETRGKLRTTLKRFEDNVKKCLVKNVDKENGKMPPIGSKPYHPVFIYTVFLDVLNELKIPCYQTQFEADDTIAYIARKLNAPIISSDSDFFVYSNLTVIIPLDSIDFRRVQVKSPKNRHPNQNEPKDFEKKPFVLLGKAYSLRKLLKNEFNVNEHRFFSLVAVVLGNDEIPNDIFTYFHALKGGNKMDKKARIEFLLKWFGRQESFERALHVMLNSIKESERSRIEDLISSILASYLGEKGEEPIWELVQGNEEIKKHLIKSSHAEESAQIDESPAIKKESSQESESIDSEEDENEEEEEDSDENECSELIPDPNRRNLPKWYLDGHIRSSLPTYLLKILVNRAVFLTPQIEITYFPSTHSLALPIIQILGGILLNSPEESQEITLITRDKSQFVKIPIKTWTKLPQFGTLPSIYPEGSKHLNSLSIEEKCSLLYESLKVNRKEEIIFVESCPVSLRLWVCCLIYFGKSLEKSRSYFVSMAILLSILKTICLSKNPQNPSNESELDTLKLSQLFQLSTAQTVDKMVKFYERFEGGERPITKRILVSSISFDLLRIHDSIQFMCILHHASMLNALLGNPLKPPRIHNFLNPVFVYNFSSKFSASDFSGSGTEIGRELELVLGKLPQIPYLRGALTRFYHQIDWKPDRIKSSTTQSSVLKPNKKGQFNGRAVKGLSDAFINRFSLLNCDNEEE